MMLARKTIEYFTSTIPAMVLKRSTSLPTWERHLVVPADWRQTLENNLKDFLSTRFVTGVEKDGSVEFDYDTRPTKLGLFSVFYPPYNGGEVNKEKAMRGIPVESARWIGSLLSQLTDGQLRDAFRAAGTIPTRPTGM